MPAKTKCQVKCPKCGAVFPYSLIAKQIRHPAIHDKNLILKIIRDVGWTTTGELLSLYQTESAKTITSRQLFNIVKTLEKEGEITTKLLSRGRYGRTTEITIVSKP